MCAQLRTRRLICTHLDAHTIVHSVASSSCSTSSLHDRPTSSANQRQRLRTPERTPAQLVANAHSRMVHGPGGGGIEGGPGGGGDEGAAQAQPRSVSADGFAPSPAVHRLNVILSQAAKERGVHATGGGLVGPAAPVHRGVEGEILRTMPVVSRRGPCGSKLRTTVSVTRGGSGLDSGHSSVQAVTPACFQLTLPEPAARGNGR